MANSHLIRILLVFIAAFAAVSRAELAVQVELSKKEAVVGDDVQARCHISNKEKVNFYINWVKKVGTEETEIGTNSKLNKAFEDSGRYEGSVEFMNENDISDVTFILNLKGVTAAESGEIGCKIPGENIEVFSKLTVTVPFSSLAISSRDIEGSQHVTYANGETITFDEDERRALSCVASGGYPQPEMKLTLGPMDKVVTEEKPYKTEDSEKVGNETDNENSLDVVAEPKPEPKPEEPVDMNNEFNLTRNLVADGIRGLQSLSYNVEMANSNLEIGYRFNNKKLTCTSKIPGTDITNTTFINIKLSGFKPQFICPKVIHVPIHAENVHIECTVVADPPILANMTQYRWPRPSSGNDSVSPGEILGSFSAALEDGDTIHEKKLKLTIDHAYTQHFRTYIFSVTNKLGTVEYGVELIEDPDYPVVTENPKDNNIPEESGTGELSAAPCLHVFPGLLMLSMLVAKWL